MIHIKPLITIIVLLFRVYKIARGEIYSVEKLSKEIKNSGWTNRNFPADKDCTIWNIHSARFHSDKNQGPTGVSCFCDWIFTEYLFYGDINIPPKFVFVQKKRALSRFWKLIPLFPQPFILLTAYGDETIPYQTDKREGILNGFSKNETGGPAWIMLTTHPNIIHFYAENHDKTHPRVSTLPIGVSIC